jgi:hypothetical protein
MEGQWKDFVGVTVRTYESKTGLWRIYRVDNTFSAGIIGPPVIWHNEFIHDDNCTPTSGS